MKIPYIKIPVADVAAYLAQFPVESKGAIFQAVLNYGLYQRWDVLELPEHLQSGYAAVQEIVENEIKNYKKFCKDQKEKAKKLWSKKQISDEAAAMPKAPSAKCQTETETEYINTKETVKKSEPELLPALKKPQTLEDAVFCEFWNAYPKQRAGSKEKARSAFAAALKRHKELNAVQLADKAKQYAKSDEVARGFAKGAQAWLNDDRFLQDYKPARPTGAALEEARERGNAIIQKMFGGEQ